MKAEHRKELETNVLANRMGRVVEAIKAPKNPHMKWIVPAVIVLIVGGIWAYFHFTSLAQKDRSALWLQLGKAGQSSDLNKATDELTELANNNRGTIVGRTAQFDVARIWMARGMENLGNPEQHASALDMLENAGKMYGDLAPMVKDMPLLQQEAMMGAARSQESLVGSVKGGNLDRAVELYSKLAEAYPDTFQGQAARKRVEELKDPKKYAEVQAFYKELNQRVHKKS